MKTKRGFPKWIIAAAVLALAALACDPPLATGVTCLYEREDGSILAPQEQFETYISPDGGLTWQTITEVVQYNDHCIYPTTDSYGNDRFWVAINPHDPNIQYKFSPALSIERSEDGGATWHREIDLSGTEARAVYYMRRNRAAFEYRAGPLDAVFHSKTGNLVVAMGYEGVLVRVPSGSWEWVTVGPYYRTDMRDLAITLPLIRDELLLALLFGLLTASTVTFIAQTYALRAMLGSIILATVTTPAIFLGAQFIGLPTIVAIVLALLAPVFVVFVILSRGWQVDRLSFVLLVGGWTFTLLNWLVLILTKKDYGVPALSWILAAGVMPISAIVLFRLYAFFPRAFVPSLICGAFGMSIVAGCYFLWGIGGISFHTEATLIALGLGLGNLLIGSRVMGRFSQLPEAPTQTPPLPDVAVMD